MTQVLGSSARPLSSHSHLEFHDPCIGVQRGPGWSSSRSRQLRVAARAADVVGLAELEVDVRHETPALQRYGRTLLSCNRNNRIHSKLLHPHGRECVLSPDAGRKGRVNEWNFSVAIRFSAQTLSQGRAHKQKAITSETKLLLIIQVVCARIFTFNICWIPDSYLGYKHSKRPSFQPFGSALVVLNYIGFQDVS